MSALSSSARSRLGSRGGGLILGGLGAVVLGLALGKLATTHLEKYALEAPLVLAGIVALVYVISRWPGILIAAIVGAVVIVPSYKAPIFQHLTIHPALVLCAVVAIALWLRTYSTPRGGLSSIDISVIAVAIGMLLAIVFGPRTWKDATAQLWLWLPPYFAGRVIAARRPVNRSLAISTVLGGVLLTPFAIAEAAGLGSPFFSSVVNSNPLVSPYDGPHLRAGDAFRVQTSFGQPIAFSMFIAIAIVFAFVLLSEAQTVRRRRLYLAAIGLLLISELLALSRTGFVVLAVAIVILAAGRARQAASRMARRAVSAGLVLLVAGALLVPSIAAVPLSIVGLSTDNNVSNSAALQQSATYRAGLYTTALNNHVASLFGNQTSKLADTVQLSNTSVDSAYLNLLDRWGLVVVLPLLAVVGAVGVSTLTRVGSSDDQLSKAFSASAVALAVGLATVALITQQEYFVWLVFGLAAGRHTKPLQGVRGEDRIWRFQDPDFRITGASRTVGQLVLPAVRRLWPIPVLMAILVAGVTVAVPRLKSTTYTATAAILFQAPQFGDLLFGPVYGRVLSDDRSHGTNVALLNLDIVARRAAAALGPPITAARVQNEVLVAQTTPSDLDNVQATDADPRIAAAIANAYATQYQKLAIQLDQAKLDALILPLERQGHLTPGRLSKLEDLTVLSALQNGGVEITQRATAASSTAVAVKKRSIVQAALLGFLLGVIIVLLMSRRDRWIRDATALEEAIGAPVLVEVPRLRASKGRRATGSVEEGDADPFGTLHARLRYFNVDRQLDSVLVTSPHRRDGRTTVALELALAEARAGRDDVLLLEADLREPRVSGRLGLEPGPGLAEVLTGHATLEEALHEIAIGPRGEARGEATSRIFALPAGATPPNPIELLESDAMHALLRDLRARFGLVIVDSAPVSVVSDALALVDHVAGVLLVTALGTIKGDEARALGERLSGLGAPLLGVVANLVYDGRRRHRRTTRPATARVVTAS